MKSAYLGHGMTQGDPIGAVLFIVEASLILLTIGIHIFLKSPKASSKQVSSVHVCMPIVLLFVANNAHAHWKMLLSNAEGDTGCRV